MPLFMSSKRVAKALHTSFRDAGLASLKSYLNGGGSPHAVVKRGGRELSLLGWACANFWQNDEIIKTLLNAGADPADGAISHTDEKAPIIYLKEHARNIKIFFDAGLMLSRHDERDHQNYKLTAEMYDIVRGTYAPDLALRFVDAGWPLHEKAQGKRSLFECIASQRKRAAELVSAEQDPETRQMMADIAARAIPHTAASLGDFDRLNALQPVSMDVLHRFLLPIAHEEIKTGGNTALLASLVDRGLSADGLYDDASLLETAIEARNRDAICVLLNAGAARNVKKDCFDMLMGMTQSAITLCRSILSSLDAEARQDVFESVLMRQKEDSVWGVGIGEIDDLVFVGMKGAPLDLLLHYHMRSAINNGRVDEVKRILGKGFDVMFSHETCEPVLTLAEKKGDPDILALIQSAAAQRHQKSAVSNDVAPGGDPDVIVIEKKLKHDLTCQDIFMFETGERFTRMISSAGIGMTQQMFADAPVSVLRQAFDMHRAQGGSRSEAEYGLKTGQAGVGIDLRLRKALKENKKG